MVARTLVRVCITHNFGDLGEAVATYNIKDFADYLALLEDTTQAFSALPDDAIGAEGRTAKSLGRLARWNAAEFAKVSVPFSDPKPGKVAYAFKYKTAHGLLDERKNFRRELKESVDLMKVRLGSWSCQNARCPTAGALAGPLGRVGDFGSVPGAVAASQNAL